MLIRIMVFTILLFSLLIGGCILYGHQLTDNSQNRNWTTADCVQDCWHGIKPGSTTYRHAIEALKTDGNVQFVADSASFLGAETCWNFTDFVGWGCLSAQGIDAPAGGVSLVFTPHNYRLGDVIRLLGTPILVTPCWFPKSMPPAQSPHLSKEKYRGAWVYFKNGIAVVADFSMSDGVLNLQPNMSILYLDVFDNTSLDYANSPKWRGFNTISLETTC